MIKITRTSLAFCALLALVGAAPAASAASATVSALIESYTVTRAGSACVQTTCQGPNETCPASGTCAPAPGCATAAYGTPATSGGCKLRLYVRVAGDVTRGKAGVKGVKVTGTVTVTTPDSCFGDDISNYTCAASVTKKTMRFTTTTTTGGNYSIAAGPFEYAGGLRNPATYVGLFCASPTVTGTSASKGAKGATFTDKPIICD